MNKELTELFDNLPEGIVLINEEEQKIALANIEFKRLFSIYNDESLQECGQHLL